MAEMRGAGDGTYFPFTTFRLPDCPYADTFFFISGAV